MELAQLQAEQPEIVELVKKLVARKPLKGMHDTKFVALGAVWSVWNWTLFVTVAATLVVGAGLAFVICMCAGDTEESDEREVRERVAAEKEKYDLKASAKLKNKESVNLGWAMYETGQATKENKRTAKEREVVKANAKSGNEVLNDGKAEPAADNKEDEPKPEGGED